MTALRKGTELGDEFVIERVLGHGGFGITYEVRALKTVNDEVQAGDRCVVKEFFPRQFAERDTDGLRLRAVDGKEQEFERLRASFAEEGRALARFFDPGIARVYMLRQAFETAYIIMEFIEGESLETYLLRYQEQRQRPMTTRDLMPIATKLVDALGLVHDAGLIHRDIKPANVMIRRNGEPVLIDFGGARPTERANQSVVYTPGFAPAEQVQGTNVGPWTDIYSLATTFYYALTLHLPLQVIDGQTVRVPLEHHPKRVDWGIPVEFARAIDWALDPFEPSRRPQSVQAWRAHLFPGSAPLSHAGQIGGGDPYNRVGGVTGPGGGGGPVAGPAPVGGYDSREMNWDNEAPAKPRRLAMFGVVMGGITALVAVVALGFVVLNPFGAPDPEWRGTVTANAEGWTRVNFSPEPQEGASIGFTADAPFRVRVDGSVYSFVDDRTTTGMPAVSPDSVVEVRALEQSAEVAYYY